MEVTDNENECSKVVTYLGRFATSLSAEDVEQAVEIIRWGRQRWNIENKFKVEKHDGIGFGYNFCNKARCVLTGDGDK